MSSYPKHYLSSTFQGDTCLPTQFEMGVVPEKYQEKWIQDENPGSRTKMSAPRA